MKIVVLALLVASTLQQPQCNVGCLACSSASNGTCVICDSSNSYYVANRICVKSTLANCALINQAGNCMMCSTGFYLSLATTGCVAVPPANVVANCAAYSSSIACTSCNSGFVIASTGGTCSALNTAVANCASHSANGVCAVCSAGFLFNANNTQCATAPTFANCRRFTYGGCSACKSGYLFNPNLYYQTQFVAENYAVFTGPISFSQMDNSPLMQSVCQAVTVQNCVNYANFSTCAECAAGYYLSSGNCIANPAPYIPNCAVYSSLTVCVSCVSGFFLNQTSVSAYTASPTGYNVYLLCSPIVAIPSCVTHSATLQTQTTCVQCSSTTYVSNPATSCVARTKINLAGCATYSVNNDFCATCNTGFLLASDNLACLAVIPNCATHAPFTSTATSLTCTACANNFILNSVATPVCAAGTIANCIAYTSASVCATCANTFYLSNSGAACTAHIAIPNCLTYSNSVANTCTACNTGYYNFAYDATCIAVAAIIPNCVTYNVDACVTCNTGFYLVSNACTAIPAASNCAAMTSTTSCTACSAGHFVNPRVTPNTCIAIFDFIGPNCENLNSGNTFVVNANSEYCVNCKTNSVPYRPLQSEAICVNSADLTAFYGGNSWTVNNCIRYGLNNASPRILVCMQCSSGNFILGWGANLEASGARTCGACPNLGAGNVLILDDLLGTVSICAVASAIPGAPGTNHVAVLARTRFSAAGWSDYQPVSLASTGILQIDSATTAFKPALEVQAAAPTTTTTASVDFAHGFTSAEAQANTANVRLTPSTFFYRGLPSVGLSQIAVPTSSPAWYTNCAISLLTTATGSIAVASGTGGSAANNFWMVITANTNICLKCADGFQLSFTALNPSTPATGNIPYPGCVTINNCHSNSAYFGGLPTYLNAMINCHSCSAGRVPTVAFEFNAIANPPTNAILSFLLGATLATSGSSGLGFQCATAPTTVTKDAASAASAITNCGVYGRLRGARIADGSSLSPVRDYCLACATGFFPTYFHASAGATSDSYIPFYAVVSCTASANCQSGLTSGPWNACGACSTANAAANPPIHYAYADHTFMNCYRSYTPNCFSLGPLNAASSTLSSSEVNACHVCNAGYFLNQDGYCEVLTVPNLGASASFVNSFFVAMSTAGGLGANSAMDLMLVRYHYALSFQALQYGASSCSGTYVRAPPVLNHPSLCVVSSYLTNNVAWPTNAANAKFILNCIRYTTANAGNPYNNAAGNSLFRCGACATGFIPRQDQTGCVATIANCNLAQTTTVTLCHTCSANFRNHNGACVSTVIANCKEYTNTATSFNLATHSCNVCNAGFYLTSAGVCTAGSVANCDLYPNNQATGCVSCVANFILLSLSNNSVYCYPVPSTINCDLYGMVNAINPARTLAQNWYSCGACRSTAAAPLKRVLWASQTTTTLAQTTCLQFVAISNCVRYSQTATTAIGNTYECLECGTGFFLNNNNYACTARTVNPANCFTFSPNSDRCSTCSAGNFINTLGTACIPNPTGVPFCTIFNSPGNCRRCVAGYFPNSQGICMASTVIANCGVYSDNNACSACTAGFWLQNSTTCTQATATNCLTFTSAAVCATCPFGFQISVSGSTTSCTAIVVANCAMLNANTQTICAICNPGFFLNAANVCTATTTTIANCAAYNSATTCSNCTVGYVLAANQTLCSNAANTHTDPNCDYPFLNSAATCAQCNWGYSFNNNQCTACPRFDAGCLICDSQNSTNCLVCKPTHYAKEPGNCFIISPPVTPVTPVSSASLVSIFLGWIALLLFFAR